VSTATASRPCQDIPRQDAHRGVSGELHRHDLPIVRCLRQSPAGHHRLPGARRIACRRKGHHRPRRAAGRAVDFPRASDDGRGHRRPSSSPASLPRQQSLAGVEASEHPAPKRSSPHEFQTGGHRRYIRQMVRERPALATREEAEANVRDLMMRWFAVRETCVVESEDHVNYVTCTIGSKASQSRRRRPSDIS
jgi:hypothetical protein